MKKIVYQHSLPLLAAGLLAACSSQTETPVEPINADSSAAVQLPGGRRSDSEDKVLADYQLFQSAQAALKQGDASQSAQFLAQAQPSAMANSLRNQWLKQLGRNGQWQEFVRQYGYLKPADRDKETRCYAALAGQENQNAAQEVLAELGRQPEGCNRLLEQLAAQGRLPADSAWRRVRGLLANNQISDARRLAAALGSPLPEPLTSATPDSQGGREALLHSVIGQNARKQADAAQRLQSLSASLSPAQTGFAWAVLGHHYALNQRFPAALDAFNRADRSQLGKEHWEWYARSA
ncbi:MAG: lytic transglycosylase domain-containing protein, partial [Eikenella corrodens]|nr:lytic transglycosylase domain-containing protein [Eikenella corrodens]